VHPRLAPIKAAVFPLVKKDGMPEVAKKIYLELKKQFKVFYDEKGAIGRRYRRQDETGTPYCITVDGQTLEDQTVTIRDRDTLEQQRVKIDELLISQEIGQFALAISKVLRLRLRKILTDRLSQCVSSLRLRDCTTISCAMVVTVGTFLVGLPTFDPTKLP